MVLKSQMGYIRRQKFRHPQKNPQSLGGYNNFNNWLKIVI